MCGSMVDIQSATAEIRRGKKVEREKLQGKDIMSTSAMLGGYSHTTDRPTPNDQERKYVCSTVTKRSANVKIVQIPVCNSTQR